MNKKLLSTLFIFINALLIGQSEKFIDNLKVLPQEKIYVHANSNFLLTGEKLYYTLYNFLEGKDELSKISKIAYVELLNSENKSVIKQQINLKDGLGSGDFFIDPNLNSETYKLIAYTQWMKNENIFFEENIFIINPFKSNDLISKASTSAESLKRNNTSKTYTKREKVNLSLKDKLKDGKYSISIKQTNSKIPNKTTSIDFSKNQYQKIKNNSFYLPEVRGNLIHGKIKSKDSLYSVSDVKIGLSVVNDDTFSRSGVTNEKGEFYFNLKDISASKILLQVFDETRDKYEIELVTNNTIDKKFDNFTKIDIDNNLIEAIKDRAFYLQVENAYKQIKQDTLIALSKSKSSFNDRKETFLLDDYKRFKTVKKTIIEVLESVFYTKEGETYSLHVREPDAKTQKFLPTLLIVDGYIVYDHNQLFDIDPKKIESIAVVRDKYVFGGQICQGLIDVKTFKQEFIPQSDYIKSFDIVKAQLPKKYYFETYQNTSKKHRIPDYRTQLYWNPNIDVSKNQVVFYTSDVTGDFEIEIEGFTQNGEPISYKEYFSVK